MRERINYTIENGQYCAHAVNLPIVTQSSSYEEMQDDILAITNEWVKSLQEVVQYRLFTFVQLPNSEPNPERSVATKMPNEQEAGQTPDSLKQARERLRYREALEKIVETFDKFKSPVNAAEMMKTLALKALQEEGK